MATRYRFGDNEKPHFITFSVVNWIDVFSREVYKEVLVESIRYCMENKGFKLYGWVIMSNHVHLLASATAGSKLADIIRDLKKYTSRKIIEAIENNMQESQKDWLMWMFRRAGARNSNNTTYQFWQQNNHPIELYNNEVMQQKLDYLHENPVKAGFVERAEDYLYSSAINYSGGEGLLPIKFIE